MNHTSNLFRSLWSQRPNPPITVRMNKTWMFALQLSFCFAFGSAQAGTLLENGGFEDPENPFAHWHVDYSWNKNHADEKNHERLVLVPSLAGKKNVVQFPKNIGDGTRLESIIIPFDPDATYEANLDVKGKIRIYFMGYKWKPGIRPHEEPTLPELRKIYKSNQAVTNNKNWGRVTLKIPTKKVTSDLQKKHLSQIRFITLFMWCEHGGSVDNISVIKR